MLVGASCTAELIQDDPGGLARALSLPIPVVALELPAYQKKENWGAAETFYQLVRDLRRAARAAPGDAAAAPAPALQHPRPDRARLPPPRRRRARSRGLLDRLGIDVNVDAPLGATPADLARLGEADFNVVLYPEIAGQAARLAAAELRPAGDDDGADRRRRDARLHRRGRGAGRRRSGPVAGDAPSRLPWYSRSVDSNYLTGKRVFVFGDATHAIAAARVAAEELGFTVVGLGTYSREFARDVRDGGRSATASRR